MTDRSKQFEMMQARGGMGTSTPEHVAFAIPGHLVSGNKTIIMASKGSRLKHAAVAKQQRRDVSMILRSRRWKPPTPVVVLIVRYGKRLLDRRDNLPFSAKHVADEIAAWYGIDDDDDRFIWEHDQVRADRYMIGVSITSVCGNRFQCSCCGSEGRCRLPLFHEGQCKISE